MIVVSVASADQKECVNACTSHDKLNKVQAYLDFRLRDEVVADVYSRCLIPRCLYRNAVTSVSAATAVCSRLAAMSVSQLVCWDLHTGTNV